LESAKFYVEYQQLQQRVRLDVPTLADPKVRDLLQESELFAQSLSGGGFGVLSPLDFIRILSLTAEIISHVLLVISLTRGVTHLGALLLTIISATLPLLLNWCNFSHYEPDIQYNDEEARASVRQERMRSLAYSDIHRPEIKLFGLGNWILDSWAAARKKSLASDSAHLLRDTSLISQLNLNDFIFALQNVRHHHLHLTFFCAPYDSARFSLDPSGPSNANILGIFRLANSIPQLDSERNIRLH
jgi:hypothetical protein